MVACANDADTDDNADVADGSGSLFLSPLPHLRETARIRRLVCFSQTCLLFVFREEGGVEFLLHYLPKWRGGEIDDDSSKKIRMNEDKDDNSSQGDKDEDKDGEEV